MDEKEPVKKRTRTSSAPRTSKKAPSAAPAKATPRAPVEVPSDVSAKAPSAAPAKMTPRAPIDAPPDRCFWVHHGPILKNLRELCDALASGISDEQFGHHVTAERNDFAAWVEIVLQDSECAQALRRAHTRVSAARALKKYVETA